MVAAADNKIFINKSNEKHKNIDRCSICGKKLKFTRITEHNVVLAVYDA